MDLEELRNILRDKLTIDSKQKYRSNDIKIMIRFEDEIISETLIDISDQKEYHDDCY